ncbi:site-2 protease family protein [bacterium]|nr:site-2 protease family protein [bacterium]
MDLIFLVFALFALIYSIILHEYAHGWMADQLGDSTAKYAGRLTLNPIPHIDPMGSIFIPAMLVLFNAGFIVGWAKPVPFNPNNLSDKKYGIAKVALAGPAANFFIALFLGMILRICYTDALSGYNLDIFMQLIAYVIWLNLLLGIFNLMPIQPLDGSKIFATFLPYKWQEIMLQLERWECLF